MLPFISFCPPFWDQISFWGENPTIRGKDLLFPRPSNVIYCFDPEATSISGGNCIDSGAPKKTRATFYTMCEKIYALTYCSIFHWNVHTNVSTAKRKRHLFISIQGIQNVPSDPWNRPWFWYGEKSHSRISRDAEWTWNNGELCLRNWIWKWQKESPLFSHYREALLFVGHPLSNYRARCDAAQVLEFMAEPMCFMVRS